MFAFVMYLPKYTSVASVVSIVLRKNEPGGILTTDSKEACKISGCLAVSLQIIVGDLLTPYRLGTNTRRRRSGNCVLTAGTNKPSDEEQRKTRMPSDGRAR